MSASNRTAQYNASCSDFNKSLRSVALAFAIKLSAIRFVGSPLATLRAEGFSNVQASIDASHSESRTRVGAMESPGLAVRNCRIFNFIGETLGEMAIKITGIDEPLRFCLSR